MSAVKTWTRYGDIAPSDHEASKNGLLVRGLRKGCKAVVLAVAGEEVPVLGLVAIVIDKAGDPLTMHLPDDAAQALAEPVLQSNPRRADDANDDNGANDADD